LRKNQNDKQQLEQVTHTEEESKDLGVDAHFQIPDELWERIRVLLPPPAPKKNKDRPGRPRMDDWKAMNAIFYVMRTGCHWKALPRSLGAPSTVHDRFQEWRDAEVFQNIWKGRSLGIRCSKGNQLGVAGYGRLDDEGSPRGEKARDQIPLTEQNPAQKEACSLKGMEFLSA
jgi:hypothetical protein